MVQKRIQFARFRFYYTKENEGPQSFEITSSLFEHFNPVINSDIEANAVYRMESKFDSNYAFFTITFGKSEPRADMVTDINTKKDRENPRKREEAELKNQVFAYYDYNLEMLFLSNQQQKIKFTKILKEQLGCNFVIKEIYGDIDKFISDVNTVKEVRFTSTDDLFSNNQAQRVALESLTGTTAPTRLTIKTNYKESKFSINRISNWLRNLSNSEKSQALSHLVVKGDNSEGFEQIFNSENLVSKIAISVDKDENGNVNSQEVLDVLMSQIERTND